MRTKKKKRKTPDWREDLMRKYDGIFRERTLPMTHTCMCWGLDVSDGWEKLLENLCARLAGIERLTGVKVIARQVKEKYGTLRFYYDVNPGTVPGDIASLAEDLIDQIVSKAEHDSGHTCESCGELGKIRDSGWTVTLCDNCFEKRERERKSHESV
jgi:hypothetical protein